MTGSIWRKWDLHFHTPSSYDYKDKGISNQEIIDNLVNNNVEVVAITDHHVIDIDRIKELQKLGIGKVTVLPGIEFRAELGGSESIHFIGLFPEDSDINDIWTKLQAKAGLTPKDISDKGGNERIYCDFKETCSLVHELDGIISVHAGGKSNSLESIKNNQEFKKALKTDLAKDFIDIFELGQVDDKEDYDNIIFPAIGFKKPMILCSDNHNIKDYKVKQHLWIKANPTFEGLKQILFEPEYRVVISENAPLSPPIRINKVTLDFPEDSKFQNEVFCFSGKMDIEFSPNFTCIIGGRGSGKSTLLNLIHEKLKPGTNTFFKENRIIQSDGNNSSIDRNIEIDNNADEKYIEFLSQNEVEDFAKDYHKLTSAVYSRIIKRDESGLISLQEVNLKNRLADFNTHISNRRQIKLEREELNQAEKEFETNSKLVNSFTSDKYLKLNDEIKDFSESLISIEASRKSYYSILEELESITNKYAQIDPVDDYEIETNRIVKLLSTIQSESAKIDFTECVKYKKEIEDNLNIKRHELKNYLSEKGLTIENQQDIANAVSQINYLKTDISIRKIGISAIQKLIDVFDINSITKASTDYKFEVEKQIKSVSLILEGLNNTSVKPISLQLEFDFDKANLKILEKFKEMFAEQISKSTYKGDNVLKDLLYCTYPKDIMDKESFLNSIKASGSQSSAKQFLLELFNEDENFENYVLLCKKTLLDYNQFKKIKVQYDGRPIEDSSFGQRCTAVLVILLLIGNNPIIIDEPEAHLDSLLISDYLVDVIKQRKNARQIIFATHNANFVVNGDSELIHILKIDEKKRTTIESTTIENKETKNILISLEGGQEAFKKRESKYLAKR